MAWLIATALFLTFAAVGFTIGVTFVVARDRRRRRIAHLHRMSESELLDFDPLDPVDLSARQIDASPATAGIQAWLDDQWNQRSGPGLNDRTGTDSSGSAEG
ncbi:MAG: hypothetical protein M3083_19600 [Actinomycetota bacterium]|nr:hypothetical protein [Actinomycetota bacterium]